MALTSGQIAALNSFFAEDQIVSTARKLSRKMGANAPLGRLTEALGIVPKDEVKQFRANCSVVPPVISSALTRAIRAHLSAVTRKGAFNGPKALLIKIRGGNAYALHIDQKETHTEVALTMKTS